MKPELSRAARRRLLARLERLAGEAEAVRALLEDGEAEVDDEADPEDEAEEGASATMGCYALLLVSSPEMSVAYPFVTEFVLDEDNVLWFSYLARAGRQKLLDFGFAAQEEWWPDQQPSETALEYFRRLEAFDGVEKRCVVVSDWTSFEMKGRFEYDPQTGEIIEHVPMHARSGRARLLSSIAGGRSRDGE